MIAARVTRRLKGLDCDPLKRLDLSHCSLVSLSKTKVRLNAFSRRFARTIYQSWRVQILDYIHVIRSLDLSRNLLSLFPPEIWRLECVEEINVSHNRLASIDLPTLEFTEAKIVGANLLHTVCWRCRTLDLEDNRLTAFPDALAQLPKVRTSHDLLIRILSRACAKKEGFMGFSFFTAS